MIIDRLENAGCYFRLHPLFEQAFRWLGENCDRPLSAADKRIALDGERLFVIADRFAGRGRAASPLEVHRRYIDIQFIVSGTDEMGWLPTARCRSPRDAFDAGSDIQFFDDKPEFYLPVNPGAFAIFFPGDAHAPLAAKAGSEIDKLIVKVEMS